MLPTPLIQSAVTILFHLLHLHTRTASPSPSPLLTHLQNLNIGIIPRGRIHTPYPNCYGSFVCGRLLASFEHPLARQEFKPWPPSYPMYELGRILYEYLQPEDIYLKDQQIACVKYEWDQMWGGAHICLFLQGIDVPTEGVSVRRIQELWGQLSDHECKVCGSVALNANETVNASGMLTANYVRRTSCNGACKPAQG